MTVKGYN